MCYSNAESCWIIWYSFWTSQKLFTGISRSVNVVLKYERTSCSSKTMPVSHLWQVSTLEMLATKNLYTMNQPSVQSWNKNILELVYGLMLLFNIVGIKFMTAADPPLHCSLPHNSFKTGYFQSWFNLCMEEPLLGTFSEHHMVDIWTCV